MQLPDRVFFIVIRLDSGHRLDTIDGSTARRCIAIVTNERRASYVIPLNSSCESRLKTS